MRVFAALQIEGFRRHPLEIGDGGVSGAILALRLALSASISLAHKADLTAQHHASPGF
jgi:hypothetical protein